MIILPTICSLLLKKATTPVHYIMKLISAQDNNIYLIPQPVQMQLADSVYAWENNLSYVVVIYVMISTTICSSVKQTSQPHIMPLCSFKSRNNNALNAIATCMTSEQSPAQIVAIRNSFFLLIIPLSLLLFCSYSYSYLSSKISLNNFLGGYKYSGIAMFLA